MIECFIFNLYKQILQEFVGLRSKMYSILLWFSEEDKRRNEERILRGMAPVPEQKSTAAGVKKCAKKDLKHELYLKTLRKREDHYVQQTVFKTHQHTIATVHQQRVGLTAYDDKRYLLEDGFTTRAHGHYRNKL